MFAFLLATLWLNEAVSQPCPVPCLAILIFTHSLRGSCEYHLSVKRLLLALRVRTFSRHPLVRSLGLIYFHRFCGTTEEFCGTDCQSHCGAVTEPWVSIVCAFKEPWTKMKQLLFWVIQRGQVHWILRSMGLSTPVWQYPPVQHWRCAVDGKFRPMILVS